jgi:hypothetical protein
MDNIKEVQSILANIDWFSNVGYDKSIDIPFNGICKYKQAKNIDEVLKNINSTKWENFNLEASNRLNAHLRNFHKESYSLWNTVANEAITCFKEIKGKVISIMELQKLPHDIIIDVRSFFIHTYIELYYKYIPTIPVYFEYLLSIYQKGKLPCGWTGLLPKAEGYEQIDLSKGDILIW